MCLSWPGGALWERLDFKLQNAISQRVFNEIWNSKKINLSQSGLKTLWFDVKCDLGDIKINFDEKEIVSLLRKIKVNYSDIISNPFLVLSSYTEEFSNSGLTTENLFYDNDKLKILENENYIISLKIPDLSPNDRFISPYKLLIEGNIESLLKISEKYNVENLFLIQIKKNDNKSLNIKIYF